MYKHIIIGIFVLIAIEATAQGAYNVEKIWDIQFKLPKECEGNTGGSKAHYWVESSIKDKFDFEYTLYKTSLKSLNKKTESILAELSDEIINNTQKETLSESKAWSRTIRNHIEVRYVEVENKYWTVFFSFEWERNAYVGWICARDKKWKTIAQTIFQSIQPAS